LRSLEQAIRFLETDCRLRRNTMPERPTEVPKKFGQLATPDVLANEEPNPILPTNAHTPFPVAI
jgi:hypothetical protein